MTAPWKDSTLRCQEARVAFDEIFASGTSFDGWDFAAQAGLIETDFKRHWGTATIHGWLPRVSMARRALPRIEYMRADLRMADLLEARLDHLIFVECDLRGINLTGADLTGSLFVACDLSGATLHGANLSTAVVYGCRLLGADLARSILPDILFDGKNDLMGADLYGYEKENQNVPRM